jgi:cbb3-type cytochrome oxidase subunit 3
MTQTINFISQYGWLLGIPIGLLAIVAWIYRPGSRRRYQADAEIPFGEDFPGLS